MIHHTEAILSGALTPDDALRLLAEYAADPTAVHYDAVVYGFSEIGAFVVHLKTIARKRPRGN